MQTNTRITVQILALIGAWLPVAAVGQTVPPPDLLPLNQIAVPEPPNLFDFVKDKQAAIRLGKAFFWDMQAGSDGVQACASCHFRAGADTRLVNTVNPGSRAGDTTFQVRGPNQTLQPSDFPFHVRADPDFQSAILRDVNDVVGSQGVTRTDFVSIVPGSPVDDGLPVADPVFQAGGVNKRRVTARNTPSTINAIFNFSNFWDGRANFMFNGENPFGPLDPNAGVWFNVGGNIVKQPVSILFASLASQATGPPLDDTEMSFAGRTFPQLGRKLLSLTPLGQQLVHPNDSVLGTRSRAVLQPDGTTVGGNGLSVGYAQLIQEAFQDQLWNSLLRTPDNFTQMEANFSLYWGLAIQLYLATQVSDQTPFDRFLGGNQAALTDEQKLGFTLFFGNVGCAECHIGTELTTGSVRHAAFLTNTINFLIDPMPAASGRNIIYDTGFNNTAVRPTTEDIGRAGKAPFINSRTGQPFPLDYSALAELQALGQLGFNPVLFPPGAVMTPVLPAQIPANFPVGNSGGFKVPGLRNIELTPPYFHNGGDMTLMEVVDFYTRGGNFPLANQDDLDPAINDIGTLQGNPAKQQALVAFMMSMTDERVRNESAPFDHPELRVPNGDNPDGTQAFLRLPARDALGTPASTISVTLGPVASPTRLPSQVVGGTKGPGVTVTVRLNGGAPIAAAEGAGGTWSASLTGLVEGANAVVVSAVDPAAGLTTLNAAIVLDSTPPALAIDAVATPTGVATLLLSGTVEAGLVPSVLSGTAAVVGPVTATNGVWSAPVTGLVAGDNEFSVAAVDAAGNVAVRVTTVTYAAPDGKLTGGGAVTQADALRALRIATGLEAASTLDLLHADVAPLVGGTPTRSGAIDVADALLILRKASGQVNF